MLFSLSEQTAFSFRADYIHSPTYQIPQEKTQEQAKAHNLPTSKSPQPFYKQSPQPSYKQSPQPHHIPNAQKTLRKQANPAKYPQYSTL